MTVEEVAQTLLCCLSSRAILLLFTHHRLMRKIEREMNAAILNNQNWQKDNTSVTFDPS